MRRSGRSLWGGRRKLPVPPEHPVRGDDIVGGLASGGVVVLHASLIHVIPVAVEVANAVVFSKAEREGVAVTICGTRAQSATSPVSYKSSQLRTTGRGRPRKPKTHNKAL